ncbi:MAG: hypothetical protein IH969_00540 [Candidatus Krumholzibacteriota bacterium]|nr:hypothetical protein [Candidatus Krumholzibacteriota bacterium]
MRKGMFISVALVMIFSFAFVGCGNENSDEVAAPVAEFAVGTVKSHCPPDGVWRVPGDDSFQFALDNYAFCQPSTDIIILSDDVTWPVSWVRSTIDSALDDVLLENLTILGSGSVVTIPERVDGEPAYIAIGGLSLFNIETILEGSGLDDYIVFAMEDGVEMRFAGVQFPDNARIEYTSTTVEGNLEINGGSNTPLIIWTSGGGDLVWNGDAELSLGSTYCDWAAQLSGRSNWDTQTIENWTHGTDIFDYVSLTGISGYAEKKFAGGVGVAFDVGGAFEHNNEDEIVVEVEYTTSASCNGTVISASYVNGKWRATVPLMEDFYYRGVYDLCEKGSTGSCEFVDYEGLQ